MLASAYARFRSGKWFLVTLSIIIAFWLLWNQVPGVYHFGGAEGLNLFLSIEASVSVGILIMAGESREALQRKQLDHIEQITEKVELLLQSRMDTAE